MRCLKCICIICHDSFLELVFKNGYWLALFSFQNTNRYPSSHLFCRQVSKYLERERPRPEAHPRLANITRKRTHLETTMPFTWRNLNRSCAFSRSLNFSLAVKVSYGTNRGWLPPPGLRKVRERTTYLALPLHLWEHIPAPRLTFCRAPRTWLTFALQFQLLLLGPDVVIVFSHDLHHSLCPTKETTDGKKAKKNGFLSAHLFQTASGTEHHQMLTAHCWVSPVIN